MDQQNILVNWYDFATGKRWISQMQKKNDDKTVPDKTMEAMGLWIKQLIKFSSKTPDELIEEAIP